MPQENFFPEQHFQLFELTFIESCLQTGLQNWEKRDGLFQTAIQRREGFLSKNELAMGTTLPNPASKSLQS